ncbi:3-deoxy-8-phosphooctulonate synthase [Rhodobaculum claviforme]|uniref:2-dehydro-3-deoxyphosphooctonate aldolase n=1 Tax=Rhodobaculum claviforme TaxID=1549854 RepID=A0A934TIL6_9RHOB|nr:3-deoxy-8-phosphooctulonate synthase [Rhodobaculum claviforme]MBK5926470.1 3-deoxy-8-phosphooctulonate synthase [Rhodobaculum claviforme]
MIPVDIGTLRIANDAPLTLIAGPCQIESADHARRMAETLVGVCADLGLGLVFKASYDKANRSSLKGARGVGLDAGLRVLSDIRAEFGCPVLTDVHDAAQCAAVAEAVDILQIPAFLCRQTDLLLAAGATGRVVNVKKGQFLAPWDMANVADKVASTGNRRILLTERGASFGYNMLVSDMRALPVMAATGYPVVFDATHSVQLPGGLGTASGGQREFVAPLARAAVAVGVAAVFVECHDDPDNAASDGPNMLPIATMRPFLARLMALDRLTKAA